MNSGKGQGFEVYKGLQRPLVFKSLKGKFIYWGMACIITAFIAGILLATLVHTAAGVAGSIIIGLGGMLFIQHKQKGGLHSKSKSAGTYIITPQFKRVSK